jgi:TetR/AcrR family transcriptional regulator, regulator of cefoperazone and chloramphenicol sensitivity
VARTANETRDKLITIGQRLFAEQGVFRVPLRLVIDQAGQKNTSALHYHFGGREGLLAAIIDRHNSGIEDERAEMLGTIRANGSEADIPAVVRAFVLPFARKLETAEGREFLRVVAQLSDLFDSWDEGPPNTPAQAHAAMVMVMEAIPDQPAAVRRERVTTMLMLVADALALRARQIDQRRPLHLADDVFVRNLIDMSVGALRAPSIPE